MTKNRDPKIDQKMDPKFFKILRPKKSKNLAQKNMVFEDQKFHNFETKNFRARKIFISAAVIFFLLRTEVTKRYTLLHTQNSVRRIQKRCIL